MRFEKVQVRFLRTKLVLAGSCDALSDETVAGNVVSMYWTSSGRVIRGVVWKKMGREGSW